MCSLWTFSPKLKPHSAISLSIILPHNERMSSWRNDESASFLESARAAWAELTNAWRELSLGRARTLVSRHRIINLWLARWGHCSISHKHKACSIQWRAWREGRKAKWYKSAVLLAAPNELLLNVAFRGFLEDSRFTVICHPSETGHCFGLGLLSNQVWCTGLSKRNGAKLRESFCPATASHSCSRPRQADA